MDANVQVLEQGKCLLGLVDVVDRRRRYNEQCVIDGDEAATVAPPQKAAADYGADAYAQTFAGQDAAELLDRAVAFVDGAQFSLLQRETLARYHAARATLLSRAGRTSDADAAFSIAAQLIDGAALVMQVGGARRLRRDGD